MVDPAASRGGRAGTHWPIGVAFGSVDADRLPMKMLHDRVLVQLSEEEGERRSSAGIVIPATAKVSTRLIWGEVLAIGQHVRALEVGDKVLFSPEDRQEVEIQGRDYVLLRERDIHALAAKRVEPATGLYL